MLGSIYIIDIEEEVCGENGSFKYTFTFLETQNSVEYGWINTIHKHTNTLRTEMGKAPLKDVVDFRSHIPSSQKFGRVVGALRSAERHSVGAENKCAAMRRVLSEFRTFHMPSRLAEQAAWRVLGRSRQAGEVLEPTQTPSGRSP